MDSTEDGKFGTNIDSGLQVSPVDLWIYARGSEGYLV